VFWGEAVSTQRTLLLGMPEEVAEDAKDVLRVVTPGSGYVFNPIHNILPEVVVENIVALYQMALAYAE